MEEYGMLTIRVGVMLSERSSKQVVVFRQHCTKREASKLIREYAKNNPTLANVTAGINWQVQPVAFTLDGEEC